MNRRKAMQTIVTGLALLNPLVFTFAQRREDTEPTTYSVRFFSTHEIQLIAQMGDIILPTTDTPSAKDLLVHQFIDLYMADCASEKEQKRLKAGLVYTNQKAHTLFSTAFMTCSKAQQQQVLEQIEQDHDNKLDQADFFQSFKQLTITGYFTSEEGATKAVNYDPLPGVYNSCIKTDANTKAWFTRW
jgi:hypothetical protein